MLLDKDYFSQLKQKVDFLTELKDEIIQKGIKINKFSKSIIYSLIRWDWEIAEDYVRDFKKMIEEYKNLVRPYPQFWKNAEISFQEYAEAMIFYYYLKEGKIPTHTDLDVDEISYLLGLMDFTGELSRKAMEEMIKWNLDFALSVKDVIEQIYLQMLEMEFKSFDLRKKVDYVANVLNRLQDKIFYATL